MSWHRKKLLLLELFHLLKYEFVCSLWWRCVTLSTNLWAFEDSSYFEMAEKFYIHNGAQISAVAILLMGASYGSLPACFDV